MRRVADEREPLADEAPGELEAEREGLGARGEADFAQPQCEAIFELTRQILGVEREERAGVGAPLVPDDARPAARKRQDGERAGGQEMLLGPALMIALVRDGRDDAGLVVVPADGRDVGERLSFERAPSAATARRARSALPSESPSSATRLPGAQCATDAVTR